MIVSAACGAHAKTSHSMQGPFSPQSSGSAATIFLICSRLGTATPGFDGGHIRVIIRPDGLSLIVTWGLAAEELAMLVAGAIHADTTSSAATAATVRNRNLMNDLLESRGVGSSRKSVGSRRRRRIGEITQRTT